MTIAAEAGYVAYVAATSQTQFAVPFTVYQVPDLEVYLNGTLTTSWSYVGLGLSSGVLTFNVPPGNDVRVFIGRTTARSQLQDYTAHDPFAANSHELALDRLVAMIQDLNHEMTLRPGFAPYVSSALRGLAFPLPVPLQLVGWNGAGTALTLFPASILQVTPDPVSGIAYGKYSFELRADDNTGFPILGENLGSLIAGIRILGVTMRVTETFGTNQSLNTMSLGGLGIQDGWGTGIARFQGTVTGVGNFRRGDMPITVDAENALLIADQGNFDTFGAAVITVHWQTLTPDTTA